MAGVQIWWIGQSGFRLRDLESRATVFVDPFVSEYEGREWESPIDPSALAQADLVLCTHEHIDHFDQPALKAAAREPGSRFTLVVPKPLEEEALELGIPAERLIAAQPDEQSERAGVRVYPVPARHGINASDAYDFGERLSGGLVRYLGYVIEFGEVRFYHAGDCIPYDGQVERLRALKPAVMLLPINGRDFFRETERNIVGNMNPREAVELAAMVGAEILIPMHWEMFRFNLGDISELCAYQSSQRPGLSLFVMGRGSRLNYLPVSGGGNIG